MKRGEGPSAMCTHRHHCFFSSSPAFVSFRCARAYSCQRFWSNNTGLLGFITNHAWTIGKGLGKTKTPFASQLVLPFLFSFFLFFLLPFQTKLSIHFWIYGFTHFLPSNYKEKCEMLFNFVNVYLLFFFSRHIPIEKLVLEFEITWCT